MLCLHPALDIISQVVLYVLDTVQINNRKDCSLNYNVLIEIPICRSLKHISSVSYFLHLELSVGRGKNNFLNISQPEKSAAVSSGMLSHYCI